MPAQTNPRKVGTTGGMTYVSLPEEFLREVGIEQGDRVVLTETDAGFHAEKVEWRTVDDE